MAPGSSGKLVSVGPRQGESDQMTKLPRKWRHREGRVAWGLTVGVL